MTRDIDDAFQALRREYIAEVPGRLRELRADVAALRAGDPGAVASLLTRFHRLVGSGGSYGFPQISAFAREMEMWIGGRDATLATDANRLDGAIERLATLFARAEAELDGPSPMTAGRRALVAASTSSAADDARDALTAAGYATTVFSAGARPQDLAPADRPDLLVIVSEAGGPDPYAAAAAWAADRRDRTRMIALLERDEPIDRLRAGVAGVDAVFAGERGAFDLARYAQGLSRAADPACVALVADSHPRGDGITDALIAAGMQVRRAVDASAARDLLEREIPDVIIVAANLSGGGGIPIIRLARHDPRAMLVPIMFHGPAGEGERVEALRAGADDVAADLIDFADLATMALVRAERGRRRREMGRRDTLTGLLNHATLLAELDHAVAHARRHHDPLAFMVIDLDRFRAVNERHGQATGDLMLAHTAEVLRATIRGSDFAGRFGGDAFALVLRGVSAEDAVRIGGKLRAAFGERPYEGRDGSTIPVATSIGCASFGADGTTVEELTHAADRALRRAKEGGRARVESGG